MSRSKSSQKRQIVEEKPVFQPGLVFGWPFVKPGFSWESDAIYGNLTPCVVQNTEKAKKRCPFLESGQDPLRGEGYSVTGLLLSLQVREVPPFSHILLEVKHQDSLVYRRKIGLVLTPFLPKGSPSSEALPFALLMEIQIPPVFWHYSKDTVVSLRLWNERTEKESPLWEISPYATGFLVGVLGRMLLHGSATACDLTPKTPRKMGEMKKLHFVFNVPVPPVVKGIFPVSDDWT